MRGLTVEGGKVTRGSVTRILRETGPRDRVNVLFYGVNRGWLRGRALWRGEKIKISSDEITGLV